MCKMIVSLGVFLNDFFKWFSRLSRGWKGTKRPKMSKISVCCTLHFKNHISYDLHLWYTCMDKRIISPGIFFIFFKILIFKIIRGEVKWEKMAHCLTPNLRNHTSYDCDFCCTCIKWWYLLQMFWFFKILIFGAFRWIKGKNDLKLPIWVCLLYYLRNCKSSSWFW